MSDRRPRLMKRDVVAGLPIYEAGTGDYLGISLGPTVGDTIETVDDRNPDDPIAWHIDYRDAEIGERPK